MLNTAPATQFDIPRATDLHQILSTPRKVTFSRCPTLATRFARCHHLTQTSQCDSQKNTQEHTSEVLRCHAKARWTHSKYCACYETWKSSSENDAKTWRLSRNDFGHVLKHVGMSRSACSRNDATRRLKPPKVTTFAELTIGTAILPSPRSLVDGCKRLTTVADTNAASSEHVSTPRPTK